MTLYRQAISKERNDQLFEELYIRYSEDIFKRIYKILEDPRDAEDTAQEAWLYILEHIEIFQGKSERSVKSYIFSVAKNKAIDLIRKRRREENLLHEINTSDIADESEMFALCAEQSDDSVLQCIMKLGEPYATVLIYYYLYHHTLKEISKIMEIKESTVGSRLTRGRKKLISLLKQEGYYE